jgi:hypothetical protein
MRKGNLVALLLLLVGALAAGEIYKWVDESGKVHYGDSPPPEIDTQEVVTPKGPSQEEVERAQQQVRKLMEQYENFPEGDSLLELPDKLVQEAKFHAVTPDNVACFSPIYELVQGPSAEPFTPITPTFLNKAQQELLSDLFDKVESRASWRGSIIELECWASSSERNSSPIVKLKNYKVRMNADWDEFQSLLTLKADITDRRNLIYRFEISDAFYFNDFISEGTIALDGNKVEVLTLNQDMVSFFIKRRIQTASRGQGTRLRGDILHMEISGNSLKLTELFYFDHDGLLVSSRTWILNR